MSDYRPSWPYQNGHVNTVTASSILRKAFALRKSHQFRKQSQSKILSLADDVRLQGFFNTQNNSANKPLVLILHGWLGCAASLYLLPIASDLFTKGFNVVRLNFRDHGDTQQLNKELFHSCRLNEVLNATQAIHDQVPHSNFYIIGFSLGGNFALRIGAEVQHTKLKIKKIISICPVMNAANALNETQSMPRMYTEYYLRRWKNMLKIKHKLFPDTYDMATIQQQRSLTDMTEHLLLQYTEFDSVANYLRGYSITGDRLKTLNVNSDVYIAEDDPVIPSHDHTNLYASEFLNIHLTQFGGHCGYLNGLFETSWIDEQIIKRLET